MGHEPDLNERWEPIEEDPDASSLAGLGEYSATGGGMQPLHRPELLGVDDGPDVPAVDSLREMYRYSLAQATGDEYSSYRRTEHWDEGPLHVEEAPDD